MTSVQPPPRKVQRHVPGELRGRAQRALRAQRPPTVPIGIRGDDNGLTDLHAREVIDLALRVGETMLGTGASASDVTGAVLRLTRAYGVRSLHADVTYTSITVSYHRGVLRDPMTLMRIVPRLTDDYSRLEDLHTLVREVVESPGEVEDAQARLEQILATHHPYRRGVVTWALALLGASVAMLIAGWQPALILLAGTTAAVVDRAQRLLSNLGLSAFFSQAVGGAIPTVVAVLLFVWKQNLPDHAPPSSLSPSVVVASGIVVLLSGLSVVSAAQDTLDGYYVTAAARTMEVIIRSAGIVAGVVGTLALAQRMGIELHTLNPNVGLSGHLGVELIAAGVVAASNAVAAYTRLRATGYATMVGGLGWLVFRLGTDGLDLSPVPATAFAAVAVGVVAQTIAVRFRVPALAIITGGVVPLLPGLTVYRGLFQLVQEGNDPAQGIGSLITAASIGLAISAGVSLGSLPIRLVRADRIQRRVLRRSVTDSRD